MGILYVVGTPIGNLEDITLRALRILKEVDYVLCEDTRVTRKLLEHYNIGTSTLSYHSHSKLHEMERVIDLLKEGKSLALVSDAGTPTISDPGSLLVYSVKKQIDQGLLTDVSIEAVPGASALVSALSISGVPASDFLFLGFLPHKKGRQTLFQEIGRSMRPVVFYESPHRIIKTLESLKEVSFGRKIVIARELTKIFEEVVSGSPEELIAHFNKHGDTVRGEFVVIVSK